MADESIRGKTLSGSVLSLDAIGSQDANYLLGDESYFVKKNQTAFPNATFQRRTQLGEPSTTYLGNTVKHVFKTKEMGDVLSNMYLKTKLPILSENSEASQVTIQFPSEVTATVPVGGSISLVNSELKRVVIGPTAMDRYDGSGTLVNENVSNNQYTGETNQITNVPTGYIIINDFKVGTKEGTVKICSINDPKDADFEVNVFVSVSNIAAPVNNPTVIDGGFREMHIKNRHTASNVYGQFELRENLTTFSNVYELTTVLEGHQVLAAADDTDYSSLNGDKLSVVNVTPLYGKFPVSSNTLTIDCPDNLRFYANVQYSNVQALISSDNRILSNITTNSVYGPGVQLKLGNNFDLTYYSQGEFSNTIGSSNVMLNRYGYNTGNVTIKHSYEHVGDLNLLFRTDHNATPSTGTELTTINPTTGTISLYANTSIVYPLATFPLNGNVTTPPTSKFSNVYLPDVSTDIGDYRTDGSYNPLFEITNQSRSTVIGVGLAYINNTSNLNYAVRVSQVGGNSFVTPCELTPAFGAYDDPGPHPFACEIDYTEIHGNGTGPQLVVTIDGWDNNKVSFMTGSPMGIVADGISGDPSFLEALSRGNLVVRRLSDNVPSMSCYFSYPRIDVYNGTSLETANINVVSSVTTIEYPGNDYAATNFTVRNGPSSQVYALPHLVMSNVVYGTASHLTATANLAYPNILTSNVTLSSLYSNTRATEYVGTVLVSESNGYMNVTTNSVTYDPLTVHQSEELDISFNVSNISLSGTYNSVTIPTADLLPETLSTLYNPDSSNIANVDLLYTKEISATLEYFVGSTPTPVLEFPIVGGYDLLVEPSLFVFRSGDSLVSNAANFSNLNTFSNTNVTIGVDHDYTTANVIGTTVQRIYEGTSDVAPFKFSDVKLSIRNDGVSYRDTLSNGITLDDQYDLPDLNAASTQTLYSGPTGVVTNPLYQSNTIYTRSNTAVYLNNSLFANTAYKTTYNPTTTITLDSYPDTISIDGQSTATPLFSNLLTYSNISYNGGITYGDTDAYVDSQRLIYSMGFAQYESNLYCVGGIDGSGSRITSVFKYDTYPPGPPPGSLKAETIALLAYPEPVSHAQCAFSSDKLFVFAPVTNSGSTKVLRYIDFDTAAHTTRNQWKLESTGFTGATNSIYCPGFQHINGKLFVVGGGVDGSANSSGVYYYDLTGRTWNSVSLGVTISPVVCTPTFALGSKLYFFDGANNGYITDTSNAYSTETITGTGTPNMTLTHDPYYQRMYMTGTSNISYIDTTTNAVVVTGDDSGIDVTGLTFNAVGSYNQRVVSVGGYDSANHPVSNIYSLGMLSNATWSYTNLQLFLPKELSNAVFVGLTSPGDIPVIKSGVYYSSRNVPILDIQDSRSTNTMQIGIKQSNVLTSVGLSSIENKGKFQNWYVNTTNSDRNVIDVGWNGKDYTNNYSQDGQGLGAVWAGDAINNDYTTTSNTYSSEINFQNSSNILNNFMTFKTTNPSGNTHPRANVVVSNVSTYNVDYSDINYLNDLMDFGTIGTVPVTEPNDCTVTLSNQFNPFVAGAFNGYPSIGVVYDTDNIPTIPWNFAQPDDVLTPGGKDMYRHYLPSKIVRSGRVDSVECFYGASRYAPAVGNSPDSYQYGVYRGIVGGIEMAERKLSLVSFSAEGNDEGNSNNYIEVYKYFSNVSNTYGKDRGWYDEVILSFGSNTTLSRTKEVISIQPGLGTSNVFDANSNATQVSDTIQVTFDNYNPADLSVAVNVTYSSSAVSRVVQESAVIKLNTKTFNILSDSLGRSGNVVMYSTHNSGIIANKLDYGTRPVSGVTSNFTDKLLSTCLSSFRYDGIASNTQENVFSSVFPVKVNMNKYNPRGTYANNVGRSLIKKVEFHIGGQLIQETDDILSIIKDEVYRTEDELESLKYLINGGADYLPDSPVNFGPIDLYIPLDLFFCRNHRTSSTMLGDSKRSTKPNLPLCAMKDQDITLSVTFYPKEYFSNTSESIDLSYLDTFVITEEATISQDERMYMMNTPQKVMIETSKKLPLQQFQLGINTEQRYEGIVADFPVKSIHWVFRSEQFENETDAAYFLHRYNFSTVVSTKESDRLYFEPLEKSDFFIDGVPQIERFGDAKFYKYYQSLKSDLTSVDKNIYNYNFSMNPGKVDPEGSLNLSGFSSNKTFFSFLLRAIQSSEAIEQVDTSRDVTIHAYAYGYRFLEFKDSRASLSFL